jgi:hypothetical protein
MTVALGLAPVLRASLWVSPSGDDGNPGSEERPFRTIDRAREMVSKMNRDMSDDITVFIEGSYHLYQPLLFGPLDSGTNGFSVIYTAAPGEHPVIDGAFRITGWSVADKARKLWSAPVPTGLKDTHDLFVNGSLASRTRARVSQAVASVPGAGPASDPKAQWRNPGDVGFSSSGTDAIWSEKAGLPPMFVENAAELLGRPGEWYFDRGARRIFYTPRADEDLATADVEAASAEAFFVGQGSKDRPVTGLVFKGIRFEYTTSLGPTPVGVSPTSPEPSAAVRFKFAAAIQFLEDEFVHMGTPAIELGPGFAAGTIEGCVFGDISWTAVKISDASDVRVTDSRFSYTATQHHGGGPIDLSKSGDIDIEHNQLDHYPNAAISSHGEPTGGSRISSNLISPPMIGQDVDAYLGSHQAPASANAGISPPYRALLNERFSPRSVPHPPTDVSAEAEDGFAYVTWTPPCLDGGPPVDSYTVASSAGEMRTVSSGEFPAKGYIVFSDLEDRTGVSFTVVATNAVGASGPSISSAPVVPVYKRKLKLPQPPNSVSFMIVDGLARIQLTAPTSSGGSPVIAYSLTAHPSGKRIVLEGRDVLHSDASHPVVRTISGFLPDPGDTVSVCAVNARGEGLAAVVKPQR